MVGACQSLHLDHLARPRGLRFPDVLRRRLSVHAAVLAKIFTTPYGLAFLLVGNGLGTIIAFLVFSITAVAPPLVVDREVDFVTAMTTSVRAVLANPRPMLAWAIVIGADLAISFATLFVALLVIFPVLGHTTWHLYRRLIV